MKHYRDFFYIFVIILLGLFAIKALFHSGFYTSLDGWHNIARLYHFHKALTHGQIPPRWVADLANGYGYPLFIFSYHAPWILAEPFLRLGFSIFASIKIVLALGFIFSGVFMYLWLKDVFGKEGGLLAGIIYMWAPYRFAKIFVGASVGEATVFLFLPLLFWGIQRLLKNQVLSGIIIAAVGLAGIILSHFIILPLLLFFVLVFMLSIFLQAKKQRVFFWRVVAIFLLGLGLACYYWLPLVVYSRYTLAEVSKAGFATLYKDHLISFSQLIYSRWGYGPIVHSAKDGEVSFQLGIVQWIVYFGSIIFLFRRFFGQHKNRRYLALVSLVCMSVAIFFSLDISQASWEVISRFVVIDYPWRLLATATFFAAILSGFFVSVVKKYGIILVLVLTVVALYSNRNHLRVNQYTDLPLSLYITSETTTNTFAEYLPRWQKVDINKKVQGAFAANDDLEVKQLWQNSWMLTAEVVAKKPTSVIINQLHFPGQTLYLDSKYKNHEYLGDGRITFPLTTGMHSIKLVYEQTPLMQLSNGISLLSLVLVGILILGSLKNRDHLFSHKSAKDASYHRE
ncbi:hypothetical protein HY008_03630 [Candidatus Woesebacteria bacterium]|nr:hypothetical protein [Candidatus Woesebacteria bacterium]